MRETIMHFFYYTAQNILLYSVRSLNNSQIILWESSVFYVKTYRCYSQHISHRFENK